MRITINPYSAILRTINGKHFLIPVVGQVTLESRVFELNNCGAFVWFHLTKGKTAKKIAEEIVRTYSGVEIQEAKKDVQEFLCRLENAGIKIGEGQAKKEAWAKNLYEIDFAPYMDSFINECFSKRIPIECNFEITYGCNLKCSHCYAKGDNGMPPSGDELTCGEICDIIDQMVEEGLLHLTLTGGEPLTRLDFCEIYEHAKDKGLLITLFTNGTLINATTLGLFSRLPPFDVEISLYGATQKTYESFTGVHGSFNRCVEGIRKLSDIGISVNLKTIVTELNVHEFAQMREFAARLGVGFRWSGLIHPRLNGTKDTYRFRLPPDKLAALELADENRRKTWQALLNKRKASTKYLYPCNVSRANFQISPFGKLCACALARHPSYDLRHGSFREGWHKFLYENICLRELEVHSECSDCDIQTICNNCPGWEELDSGNQGTKVDYLCQLAHARAEGLHGFADIENYERVDLRDCTHKNKKLKKEEK